MKTRYFFRRHAPRAVTEPRRVPSGRKRVLSESMRVFHWQQWQASSWPLARHTQRLKCFFVDSTDIAVTLCKKQKFRILAGRGEDALDDSGPATPLNRSGLYRCVDHHGMPVVIPNTMEHVSLVRDENSKEVTREEPHPILTTRLLYDFRPQGSFPGSRA